MKKLSLLVALALLVTVGGVYATWTYTSDSADIVDATKEIVVELEDATTTGAAGTFTVTSNLALVIDQITEADGSTDHKAKLEFNSNDGQEIYLTVTFTPAKNASQDIKEHAVLAELYWGVTKSPTNPNAMKYPSDANGRYDDTGTHKDIFEFANPASGTFEGDPTVSANAGKAINWVKQLDGTFTATYNEAALRDMIKLNGTIILDTKSSYDAFHRDCLTGNIVAHVTDGTVNGSPGQG